MRRRVAASRRMDAVTISLVASFEMPTFGRHLSTRLMDNVVMIRTSETLY
jgi:hypothetical protein